MRGVNERQKRYLVNKGIDLEKVENLANEHLKKLQKEGVSLEEAKIIIKRMTCTLEESGKYRSDTPLHKMPIRIS